MSSDDLERFRAIVLADVGHRQRLRGCVDGAEFAARAVALGRELGLELDEGALLAALREVRRAWQRHMAL